MTRGVRFRRSQIMDRIDPKLGEATRGAEIIGLPLVLIGTGCRSRLHRHPTDGIDDRTPPSQPAQAASSEGVVLWSA